MKQKQNPIYNERDYFDAQFGMIREKLETLERIEPRVASLEHTRSRMFGWFAGISVSGGSFGAWIYKHLPTMFG